MKVFTQNNPYWFNRIISRGIPADSLLPDGLLYFNSESSGGGGNRTAGSRRGDRENEETDENNQVPVSESGGTGSGAATNDYGSRIHDIDSGTGSAQRGNQAGMEEEDQGTITGGTMPSTGLGDAQTAMGDKLSDEEKAQKKQSGAE